MHSMHKAWIETLRQEYGKIETIDPCSESYAKLIALLDKSPQHILGMLASADIKFVSKLARNRIVRS